MLNESCNTNLIIQKKEMSPCLRDLHGVPYCCEKKELFLLINMLIVIRENAKESFYKCEIT